MSLEYEPSSELHHISAFWKAASFCSVSDARYRGTSPIRNSPPLQDHHRTLGIVLLWGPSRGVFFMSEVPLQCAGYRIFGCRILLHPYAPCPALSSTDCGTTSLCRVKTLCKVAFFNRTVHQKTHGHSQLPVLFLFFITLEPRVE